VSRLPRAAAKGEAMDAESLTRLMRVVKNAEQYNCKRLKERHVLDACAICNIFYALDEFVAASKSAAAKKGAGNGR